MTNYEAGTATRTRFSFFQLPPSHSIVLIIYKCATKVFTIPQRLFSPSKVVLLSCTR